MNWPSKLRREAHFLYVVFHDYSVKRFLIYGTARPQFWEVDYGQHISYLKHAEEKLKSFGEETG